MADVFKNEMNWSTYQDKQLSVLVSLERSFHTSLVISKATQDNLSTLQTAMTSMINSATSLANFVNNLNASRGSGGKKSSNARAAREAADLMKKNLEEAHRLEMENAKNIYEQNMNYLEDQVKAAREELENTLEQKRAQKEIEADRKAATEYIRRQVLDIMNQIGKVADNYLKSSNNLIKVTGNSASAVQSARGTIVTDIIAGLNRETGYFYSPQESYAKMVSIANEANVGNIEALKEMTRPILLADETLNANIGSIATLFNRFYTRYSFSSIEMESIVDEIRSHTAGNSSTAQATLENISKLENLIAIYSDGDKDQMSAMIDSISTYTSYLESMGVDTSSITSTMYDIMLGNKEALDPSILAALDRAGSSFEEAQYLLRNDVNGMEKVVNMFATGTEDLISQVIDSKVAGMSLDALGVPKEYLDLYAALNSSGAKTLEEFEAIQSKNTKTAVDTVESMYVSATDKINHWLEGIYNGVADLQNTVGFGLTDIVGLVGIIAGVTGGAKLISKGFGKSGGGGWSLLGHTEVTGKPGGGAGTGLLGTLEKGGFNASGGSLVGGKAVAAGLGTAAGAAAGFAGAYYGGSKAYDQLTNDVSSDDKYAGWNMAGGALAGVGGGALTASLLGVGAAAGPIGWIALALGGVALAATDAAEAMNTFGSADAVEKAYNDAADSIARQAREYEDTLLDIKVGLSEYNSLVDDESKLEAQRNALIQSGILSESDVEKARKANASGLMELTEAYLKATNQWSEGTKDILDKYKREDTQYISKMQDTLEETLQTWNDAGMGSEQLKAVDNLMYSIYGSLQDRKSSGEEFDEDTAEIYKRLGKVYKDGKLSASEANDIIDAGFWNTTFQNSNLGSDDLIRAVEKMGETNAAGERAYEGIMTAVEDMSYFGVSKEAADWMQRANSATTEEEAKTYLDKLRSAGYSSSKYSEVESAASKWGLSGYAVGTNYITHDQIAFLHEGEAVVPKKYNPAANMNELEVLRDRSDHMQEKAIAVSKDSNELLSTVVSDISEIKRFLAIWKEDNMKRDIINSAKDKNASAMSYISRYLMEG